jgi:hypothetical protein
MESPYYRHELQLDEFMSALKELFPATVEPNPKEGVLVGVGPRDLIDYSRVVFQKSSP